MKCNETLKDRLGLVKNLRNILVLALFLGCSFYGHASKFLDIDNFALGQENSVRESLKGKKGLRVIIYDIDDQKFCHVDYYGVSFPPQNKTSLFSLKNDISVSVLKDGDIEVQAPSKEILKSYTFRTVGNLILKYKESGEKKQKNFPIDISTQRAFVRGFTPLCLSSQRIIDRLKIFSEKQSRKPFKVLWFNYDGGKLLESTEELFTALGTRERGKLGELATELTMRFFGYKRILSQYERGNGFDGVYHYKEPILRYPTLFLTESKCRNEDVSAESYMEGDLSEHIIFKRLKDSSYHDSANFIENFMINSPERIFKAVHRIKEDGTSQYCFEKFNIHQYRLIFQRNLSKKSDEQEKQMAVAHLRDRLGISREDMISLVKKSYTLSEEEIRQMGFIRTSADEIESRFGDYSPISLKKIIKLICDNDSLKDYKKTNQHKGKMTEFLADVVLKKYGLDISRGPIENIIYKKGVDKITEKRLWNCITQNFDKICTDFLMDKDKFFEEFAQQ